MFNIFGNFDTYEVDFEVYVGNALAQRQKMQVPKEMLMINFIQTAQQLGKDSRPMKIKMVRPETIWDNFENKEKTLNCEVEFKNNAMMSFEASKEE